MTWTSTADEIWKYIPGDHGISVFLEDWYELKAKDAKATDIKKKRKIYKDIAKIYLEEIYNYGIGNYEVLSLIESFEEYSNKVIILKLNKINTILQHPFKKQFWRYCIKKLKSLSKHLKKKKE